MRSTTLRPDANSPATPARRRGLTILSLTCCAAVLAGCGAKDAESDHVQPIAAIASDRSAPAANGIDQLAPADALAASIDAMEAAGTFAVSGTSATGNTLQLQFQIGVGAQGTITSDAPVQLLAADGAVYVTGDPATLAAKVGADVDTTIASKWLLLPPESASGFGIFADGVTFAEAVLGSQAPSEVTSVRQVDGTPAVGLLFRGTGATLWVSATGEPVPLRLEEKGATAGKGVLTFAEYGSEIAIAPPAPESVVDPSAS